MEGDGGGDIVGRTQANGLDQLIDLGLFQLELLGHELDNGLVSVGSPDVVETFPLDGELDELHELTLNDGRHLLGREDVLFGRRHLFEAVVFVRVEVGE